MLWKFAVGIAAAVSHDDERQKVIDEINAHPGVLWTAGHNERFRGLPVGASKSLCGVKPESAEQLRAGVASGKYGKLPKHDVEAVEVPESFDAAEHWPECAKVISDIRDQSACGCCWAFGAAEAASDRLCIATKGKITVPLSAQETCFCGSDDGCGGGMLGDAWEYIQQEGVATGGQYHGTGPFGKGLCSDFSLPHCHHHGPQGKDPFPGEGKPGCPVVGEGDSPACPTKCDAGAKAPYDSFKTQRYTFKGEVNQVDPDPDAIAREIMTNGPVEAAFDVMSDFENYVSGIYHTTSEQQMGGHAIKLVGWGVENGVKYWKVQNSWNPYWGEKGYFRIKRGTDECGIEDQVVANSGAWSGPGIDGEILI
jgi:cathepsin B